MNRYGKETVAMVNGKPCIRYEIILTDEPTKFVHYWPIGQFAHVATTLAGSEAHSSGEGTYRVRRGSFDWVTVRLLDGGKTTPIKTEKLPIPPPKTRLETRWYNGRWEKYSKREGWIPA